MDGVNHFPIEDFFSVCAKIYIKYKKEKPWYQSRNIPNKI